MTKSLVDKMTEAALAKLGFEKVEESSRKKLDKGVYVHHEEDTKKFAGEYHKAMIGDHRSGGPTEADEKHTDKFFNTYHREGKSGFAGSGHTIYTHKETGEKHRVDRHANGEGFHGTDHVVTKLKEEVEPVEEISRDLANRYQDKADRMPKGSIRGGRTGDFDSSKVPNRQKGLRTVQRKLIGTANVNATSKKKSVKEDIESVEELNRDGILTSYISKTNPDYKSSKEIAKRKEGRALALKKRWGDKKYGLPEPKVKAVTREENEAAGDEINEISKKVLGSYIKGASRDVKYQARDGGRQGVFVGTPQAKKANARLKGIDKATDRLTKESVQEATTYPNTPEKRKQIFGADDPTTHIDPDYIKGDHKTATHFTHDHKKGTFKFHNDDKK